MVEASLHIQFVPLVPKKDNGLGVFFLWNHLLEVIRKNAHQNPSKNSPFLLVWRGCIYIQLVWAWILMNSYYENDLYGCKGQKSPWSTLMRKEYLLSDYSCWHLFYHLDLWADHVSLWFMYIFYFKTKNTLDDNSRVLTYLQLIDTLQVLNVGAT